MKKSKLKKEDIVEISKNAFRSGRQSGKSRSNADIIKRVVEGEEEDRNPDSESAGEKMESLETLVDSPQAADEDALQVFRDVLSMSDEERNMDVDGKLAPLRIMGAPPPGWSDDPANVKFAIGELVRYRGNPTGKVYKVCGAAKEKDTYSIKGSESRDPYDAPGDELVKAAKGAVWVDYWSLHPVIPAPKPWLKVAEKVAEKGGKAAKKR